MKNKIPELYTTYPEKKNECCACLSCRKRNKAQTNCHDYTHDNISIKCVDMYFSLENSGHPPCKPVRLFNDMKKKNNRKKPDEM